MKKDQSEFGAPVVDNTPTGRVGMLGEFFRGVSDTRDKSKWVKLTSIIFCLVFLILPGVFALFISFVGYQENGLLNVIVPIVGGLIFVLAGVVGIKANLKS
jgi:hypothetical protein